MKHIFYKLLMCVALLGVYMPTFAMIYRVNGITYCSSDYTECEVVPMNYNELAPQTTRLGGYSGDIVIPEYIDDRNAYGDSYSITVTGIGDNAFCNCEDVTSIKLPSTITRIGKWAFDYCTDLTSLKLGDKVETIDEEAFTYCSITSMVLPNSVKKLGKGAFKYCDFLKRVTVGKLVEKIEPETFFMCEDLVSVKLSDAVTSIGEQAFYGCKKLGKIDLPKYLQIIGDKAFESCYLTEITIPSMVTTIGDNAFDVTSVTCLARIPPTIAEYTFGNVSNKTLYVPNESYKTAPYWKDFGTIVCSEDLIQNEIFTNDGIYYEVTSESEAKCQIVSHDSNMADSVIVPETVEHNGVTYTVTNLAANSFDNVSMKLLTLPHNISINANAINEATIDTLILYTKVVDDGAISGSTIKNLIVKPQVEQMCGTGQNQVSKFIIEDGDADLSFANAELSVPELYLGRNISDVNISSLSTLTIGKDVNKFAGDGFVNCSYLRTVNCYNSLPPSVGNWTFSEYTYDSGRLYVNVNSIDAYSKAESWKNFKQMYGIITFGPTFVVNGLEYNITSETDFKCELINVPEGIVDVAIPETVEYEGITFDVVRLNGAFNAGSFGTVTVPASISYIANSFTSSKIEKLIFNPSHTWYPSAGSGVGPTNSEIGELVFTSHVTGLNLNFESCSIRKITLEDSDNPIEFGLDDRYTYGQSQNALGGGFKCKGLEEMYVGRDIRLIRGSYMGSIAKSLNKLIFGEHFSYLSTDVGGLFGSKIVISYNSVPPTVDFLDETYSEGILYVPESAIEIYKNADYWKNFVDIRPLSELSGVKDVANDLSKVVNVAGRTIYATGNVTITNLSGLVVFVGQGDCSVDVAPGIYIVTVDNTMTKVAVK
jgi:hypothetical protein